MNDQIKMADLIDGAPNNFTIQDALGKCLSQVRTHEKLLVAISGGWDSDIMADMVIRCGGKDKSTFVFFNTGLEYEATRKQLAHIEEKYGIEVAVLPPIKPIPLCVRKHGIPFWSKHASEMISRLQRHGFSWEDEPYIELIKKYPQCRSSLRWWCNDFPKTDTGRNSKFNISYVPGLKEFLISYPPDFKISAKCCHYAKKEPVKKFLASGDFDLNCQGVRKAEGGDRASAYKSCYTQALSGPDQYRPLFWFSDADKAEYDAHYGITHSDCYKVWGMKRTGCAGCPFGKDFEKELALAEQYEPKFHKAMLKVFGASYDYTRKFLAFRQQLKLQEKNEVAANG